MKRAWVLSAGMASLVVLLSGCSEEAPGSALPASNNTEGVPAPSSDAGSAAPSAGNQAGPLADTDPCSLFPQSAAQQIQLPAGQPGKVDPGVSRACSYQGSQYGVEVIIFDTLGYQRPDANETETPVTIGGSSRPAVQREGTRGLCAVAMQVTETSSVDVSSNTVDSDQKKSCQLTMLVAQAIEPNLPKN